MKHKANSVKDIVASMRKHPTRAEKQLRQFLARNKIKYVFKKSFPLKVDYKADSIRKAVYLMFPVTHYIADFYLPQHATVIEILHGDGNKTNTRQIIDRIFARKMVRYVLRFTEKDVIYNSNRVCGAILSQKCIRTVHHGEDYQQRHQINKDNEQKTSMALMIYNDKETPWYKKKTFLKGIYQDADT